MARRQHSPNEKDSATERTRRRLKQDLGVNAAGIEVILHLRGQVLRLQARVRELEMGMDDESRRRGARLAQYRERYFEATWIETSENSIGNNGDSGDRRNGG